MNIMKAATVNIAQINKQKAQDSIVTIMVTAYKIHAATVCVYISRGIRLALGL